MSRRRGGPGAGDDSFDLRTILRLRPSGDGTVDLAGYPTATTAGVGGRRSAEQSLYMLGAGSPICTPD